MQVRKIYTLITAAVLVASTLALNPALSHANALNDNNYLTEKSTASALPANFYGSWKNTANGAFIEVTNRTIHKSDYKLAFRPWWDGSILNVHCEIDDFNQPCGYYYVLCKINTSNKTMEMWLSSGGAARVGKKPIGSFVRP